MAKVDPLQYAMQLERDGQAFYTEVAAATRNPLGKRMFESLAADERHHEEILVGIAKEMSVPFEGELPKERLVTLFATLGEELKAHLDADADDNRAIEKALEMEKASIEHYTKLAKRASAERDRRIYARLVQEEGQHVDILQNCLTYLNKTGQWFLWDEQALLDGG